MAIYRKDGSIHKVRGPNKILAQQHLWDNDEVVEVFNFDDLNVVTLGDKPHVRRTPEPAPKPDPWEAIDKLGVVVSEEPASKVVEKPREELEMAPLVPKAAVESEPPRENDSPYRRGQRELFFCLPATVVERIDHLYNEKISSIKYAEPFKMQAVIVQSTDVRFVLWTTIDKATTMSVIFHPSRRRWWKVQEVQADASGDGLLLVTVPSDLKPDFSAYA